MTNLKKALRTSIKEHEIFLDLMTDHATEGCFFWDRNETTTILLDAKLSSEFSLQKSETVQIKDLSKFYAHFLGVIIDQVERSYQSELLSVKVRDLDLHEHLPNTDIKFAHYTSTKFKTEYFLVAIPSTDYFYKGKKMNKYSSTFDLATWQLNVITNELIINDNWAKALGYTLEELSPVGFQTFVDLAHPDDVQSTMEKVNKYVKGEAPEYSNEIRMRHKNGYWRWVLGKGKTVSKTEDGQTEWMMGINYDITDKKIHEQEVDILSLVPINSFNSIIIADAEGRITFVNASFEKLSEYKSHEVLGKKPGSFLQGPNTDSKDMISFKEKLKSGKSFTQQILNYSKSGREYITSCSVDPIYNENSEIVRYISIQRDVTQEIKDHQYLSTFKKTLDQTDDCIFIFDGETLEFTYVNSGAINMMEYAEQELLGLHPIDIKPEFSKEKFMELINPLKSGEVKSKRFKTLHRIKSGRDIPVEVFLQYIKEDDFEPQFIAIVQDITERIKEKNNLERLSLVAENTTNLVVITDEKGRVEYVNKAFEAVSGYSSEEMVGQEPGKVLHGPNTNHLDIKAYKEGLKQKIPFTQEILNYSKSGKTYWVSIAFNPIFNDENKLVKYIAIETEITKRKEQEEKLRESEERLQFVLEGSEIGYWDWDSSTGKMTVNDRWFQMLGYSSADFKPTIDQWHSLVHPEDMPKLKGIMENVFPDPSKSEFSVEVRAKHKSGEYRWILDKGSVVKRDSKGAPSRISGMHLDVTARKVLEYDLEEERNFLSNVISTNALSLIIINKNGKITYANKGAEHILGLKKSFIEKKHFDDPDWHHITMDGDSLPSTELPFAKVLSTKKSVKNVQHGIIWKDGTKKYISVTGMPFTVQEGEVEDVIFSVNDITERIEAQKELDETRDQTQNILKEISDVVWSVSLPDYNLEFITPSIEKVTGHPVSYYTENYIGKKWEITVFKGDEHIINKIYEDLDKKGSFEAEYRIRTKDNEVKWVLNKGTIIYKDGKPHRMDGFLSEITDRKETELEIQRYLQIVEDQNERLKNFTYIVSHNLRSHSANIQGLMYLINKKHCDIAENEYVKMLNKASNKLDDTLHHLNDVVSVVSSTEQIEKVNLSDAFTSFLDTFENSITNSNLYVILEIPRNVTVQVVPAFLESIITNLMTNAMKYKDALKPESFIKIYSRNFNGIVIIHIEDNGLGIDLNKYGEKLFGMYKTFHQHEDSRGLGLFLTKNQVESMGGKIEVESTLGIGSTFKVFLKDGDL